MLWTPALPKPALPESGSIAPRTTGWRRRRLRTAPGERIYAIGDIHGRLDLFGAIMARIRDDHLARSGQSASIIVLGDFVDRGPCSRGVVDLLRRVSKSPRFRVLMGNHEASLLDCARARADPREGWLDYGGAETLASYAIAPPAAHEDRFDFAARLVAGIGRETLHWMARLPLSVRSGDYFFCHAGIRPGVALARQSPDDLLWMREPFLSDRRDPGVVVIHGHTVSETIDIAAHRIGIDTGAYATGRLTALGLAGERLWWLQTPSDADDDG